jgi:aryl carrier-like protein
VDAIPRLISGKIDYAALPAPDSPRPELSVDYAPPETPVQKALATIWSEIISIDRIGIHDNFFELGGTSLDLMQAKHKARACGLELSIATMLAHQTIAELSAVAGTVAPEAPVCADPPVEFAAAPKTRRRRMASDSNMVFESLGVYLPARMKSTDEIVAGCALPLEFPLAQMTGILRRPAADGEYSIDLARRAVVDCLSRSQVSPSEVDVLICCNISRCDGPDQRFSYEPSTAARLQAEFGFFVL